MAARYDSGFYDTIRAGSRASAKAVVPRLFELAGQPRTVVDVGSGEGVWTLEFLELGAEVLAIDGSYVTAPLVQPFLPHDLERPLPGHLAGRFDFAYSLEVAEHLSPTRARSFVADLVALAPVVAFSAAIPGQGGTGHVNEQWPDYWRALFESHGFRVTGALRFEFWRDERVENWYRQNLLLAVAADHEPTPELEELLVSPLAPTYPLVHPVLFDHVRSSR